MEKIRAAVIGAGNMGMNHLRVYKALNHICELTGVYDSDADRCARAAARYEIKAFRRPEEIWDSADAASIVTPTVSHYVIAKEGLMKGLHVLLEKPITETVEQGDDLTRIADEVGRVLQIGHVERFNPAVQVLPEILDGKEIIGLDFRRMSPYDSRIQDVGVVHDLMIHDIDVLRFLLPLGITGIQAYGSAPRSGDHTDYAAAAIQMAGGVIATLTASRVTEQKVRTLSITTGEAYIEMDYIDRRITVARAIHAHFHANSKTSYRQENITEKVFVPNREPLMDEIEAFLRCVLEGASPLVGGEDGVAALRIANRIERCIRAENKINNGVCI